MIKILVLGSTGMLGHMVFNVLSGETTFNVVGTHHKDVSDFLYFDAESGFNKLEEICKKYNQFDYLINCIGFTNNNINEELSKSVLRAIRINSLFPHILAEFASNTGARIIHISTDGVFSGTAEYYYEDDPHDCTDVYGKTKSLGEVVSNNFLNIRCSIMGPSPFAKNGLYEWFQSRPDGETISGYTNHIWNGVSTAQFAELCLKIIKNNCFYDLREESHVFHFAPNKEISKYELLKLFKTIFKKDISIIPVEHGNGPVKRILKSKYSKLAKLYYEDGVPMDKVVQELSQFCTN